MIITTVTPGVNAVDNTPVFQAVPPPLRAVHLLQAVLKAIRSQSPSRSSPPAQPNAAAMPLTTVSKKARKLDTSTI